MSLFIGNWRRDDLLQGAGRDRKMSRVDGRKCDCITLIGFTIHGVVEIVVEIFDTGTCKRT